MEETREHSPVKRPIRKRCIWLDALSKPELADIELDPPRVCIESKAAEFEESAMAEINPGSGAGRK